MTGASGTETARDTAQVQVQLPHHLRNLAGGVGALVTVEVRRPVTVSSILDAVETCWPALKGTIRDHASHERRPFVRFFACERDFSLESQEVELPVAVADGREPFLVIGAIAGG